MTETAGSGFFRLAGWTMIQAMNPDMCRLWNYILIFHEKRNKISNTL